MTAESLGLSILIVLMFLIFYSVKKNWADADRKSKETKEQAEQLEANVKKYKHLKEDGILACSEITPLQKAHLLGFLCKYSPAEAFELIEATEKAKEKIRKRNIKRKANEAAYKSYGNIPFDNKRQPIPDEVKEVVWRRDGGKCAKCGSQIRIEFDHILPVAKGGSNTVRNIQILCEACNREKSDNIV